MQSTLLACLAGLAISSTSLAADGCRTTRVVTDANGTRLQMLDGEGCEIQTPATGSVLWTYRNGFAAISQSVAFGPSHLWAGQSLNGERLQSFVLPGDGTPTDYAVHIDSPVGVGSSAAVDRVAIIDGVEYNGPFTIRGFSTAGPSWTFDVPTPYGVYYSQHCIKVSRDGSTVAAGFNYYDQTTQQSFARAYFLNAATGEIISQWDGSGGITAVSITDDGRACLVTNDFTGRLIDTATGTQTFSATGVGSGGWYQISGNGATIVVGGFDVKVWHQGRSGWVNTVSFSAPSQWFAWGFAVSRDGSTVCSLSHIYLTYLEGYVRAWDAATGAMLGEDHYSASGSFQDSAFGAAMNDDGSRFAVANWGAADNAHPEVRIYDRTVTQVGAIDTPGSPFTVAMSPTGQFTASGSKAVHANTFGNGGDVSLFGEDLGGCAADFNGDDVVDFFDYLDFVQAFADNDPSSDFNGDDVIDFFDYLDFVQAFSEGC